ncbi:pilin [Patescibacteria group bacterium]|nr:pilin [Patescibacteria group bacterium]
MRKVSLYTLILTAVFITSVILGNRKTYAVNKCDYLCIKDPSTGNIQCILEQEFCDNASSGEVCDTSVISSSFVDCIRSNPPDPTAIVNCTIGTCKIGAGASACSSDRCKSTPSVPPPNSCEYSPPIDNCDSGYTPVRTQPDTCECKPVNEELVGLFSIINGIVLPLAVILGLFLIVLSGYKILTSQGNPQELQTGKENLTSAIIGLIFVLMAVSILRVIIKALITGDADPF